MQNTRTPIPRFNSRRGNAWKKTCMSGVFSAVIAAQSPFALGADPATEKLADENKDLRKRLEALENILQKEGLAPSCDAGASGSPVVKALGDVTLSGFVTASYF